MAIINRRREPAAAWRARARVLLLLALTAGAGLAAWLRPPLPQAAHYHRFADQRPYAGLVNAANVASNLPFLVAGALGLALTIRALGHPRAGAPRAAQGLFFAGLLLTGVGSAYYHLDPTNATLLWDRLPMTVAFMAFLAMVIADRIDQRLGAAMLWPLIAFGAASVIYWHQGEQAGHGDLRWYAFVQFHPLLLIPLLAALYPATALPAQELGIILALYAAAKGCELADQPIYAATGWISGHTLKHLVAAAAGARVLTILRQTPGATQPEAAGTTPG